MLSSSSDLEFSFSNPGADLELRFSNPGLFEFQVWNKPGIEKLNSRSTNFRWIPFLILAGVFWIVARYTKFNPVGLLRNALKLASYDFNWSKHQSPKVVHSSEVITSLWRMVCAINVHCLYDNFVLMSKFIRFYNNILR